MKISGICRFCDIVSGRYHYTGVDEPFASNDEFVAVASIGALVEGWSLIIPKAHQLSMRNIYTTAVFADFLNAVVPPLFDRYGPLIAFEHGANKVGSTTGCGTDHAHLHLVPFGESLLPDLRRSGLQWTQGHSSEIASKSGAREYLFYTELNGKKVWRDPLGYLHVLEVPLSQFFRRLMAKRSGKEALADYRRFPHLDTSIQTRIALAGSLA